MTVKRFMQLLRFRIYKIFPRFKFRRICKELQITPYKWQKDFALGVVDRLQYPEGRATGKTMAVMLKLLMLDPIKAYESLDYLEILRNDPDFKTNNRYRLMWYEGEYKHLSGLCYKKGIPVPMMLHIYMLRGL